jgi:predicted nucleic acid-binding protein
VEAEVILVDTNAWVRHLREADPHLMQLLRQGRVRTCDVVIGELLLGSGLPARFAKDLMALPRLPSPTPTATLAFIERHRRAFAASGVGWADAQVIHAAMHTGARIHTVDRAVRRVVGAIGLLLA